MVPLMMLPDRISEHGKRKKENNRKTQHGAKCGHFRDHTASGERTWPNGPNSHQMDAIAN
jgi:hypothetical protein